MAEPNPFAALVPTTQNLNLQRRAQFAQSPGDSFWAQQAGLAGLNAREQMLYQGQALSPQDERAISTDNIMKGAQKRLADLVQSGEVDPLDAQELVISETMSAFMRAGDYQAAQSLLPGLNQIRTYREELKKLRAETFAQSGTGTKAMTEAAATASKLPFETAKLEAEQRANLGSEAERFAHARLFDRTDPNIRAKGGGSGEDDDVKIGTAEQAEVRASFHGTVNALNLLSDLSTIMKVAPGAASIAGQVANTGGQFLAGVRNWMSGRGSVSPEDIESLDSEQRAIVERNMREGRAARVAQAQSLGMSVTQYESLVVEVAYALARVNDPGGRLSNNDFDYALKQLGAVQDPKSAMAAFASIADRAARSFKTRLQGYTPERKAKLEFDILEKQVTDASKVFRDKWGGGTLQDTAAGNGASPDRHQELRNKYVKPPSK